MTRVAKKSRFSALIHKLRAARYRKAWDRTPEAEQLRMNNDLRFLAKYLCRNRLNADDLVNETFIKVFSGDRKWQRDLDLLHNLYGVLSSLVSNERRKIRRLVALDDKADEVQNLAAIGPTALQQLEADEQQRLTDEMIQSAIAADPFLSQLVGQLLELGWKPTKIALALGVHPEVIYSQKRRLQRKFAFLRPVKQEGYEI